MDLYSTLLELLPLEGLRLGEQLLPLAASKELAVALLGPAEEFQGDQWYYAESELRLDFDQSGRLEFIEFLGGLEGRLQPTIYGLPAFQTGAGELIEELTRRNDGPVDDREQGYSYASPPLTIRMWSGTGAGRSTGRPSASAFRAITNKNTENPSSPGGTRAN